MMARRTKAEAEATRQSILNAAEQVFLDKGVARASLEEIARTANVTRGAIYWHFRNKTDLFEAMLQRVHDPITEMVENVIDEDSGELSELKRLCIFALKALVEDERHYRVYRILFHLTESERSLAKQEEMASESIINMTRYFTRHPHHPSLTPIQAARSLHTQMLGIYVDWLRDPQAYDLKVEAEPLVDTIFRGICPDLGASEMSEKKETP